MIVVVRPWKLPAATIISGSAMPFTRLAQRRAALIAVSTASAPVFIGRATSSPVSCAEFLEKRREPIIVKGAGRHREPLRLLSELCKNSRMRVTEADSRIGAHHVDVAPAFDVPQICALSAREHDGQRVVVSGDVRVPELRSCPYPRAFGAHSHWINACERSMC